ncbi:glycosyltransferase [Cohnella caldifontis]|uniref:glycosyltransferase n=1 Tax=Cohnella caldifontis TaxID=3027471 RepID=UPI0023EB01C7|nr:glycosyltransferase [Cohnella sp. YIM B05605]
MLNSTEDANIAFYISDHGFGHINRCLAIIEELLARFSFNIYIASGEQQIAYARIYLAQYSQRIVFKSLKSDVGLTNKKDSLQIDIFRLEVKARQFIDSMDELVKQEVESLLRLRPRYIICDISPIGPFVASSLEIKCIGISNFTWVEQYKYLNISRDIINFFENAYSKVDVFIKYQLALPFPTANMTIHDVDLISRKLDTQIIEEYKQRFGQSIFITCGKSARLNIRLKNYDNCVFTTNRMNITTDGRLIQLPSWVTDTQNYIGACELVISKAGWGTIAETLIAHKKLVLIERPGVFEDTYLIENLRKNKLAVSIREEELAELNILELMERANDYIDDVKLMEFKNDTSNVVEYLSLYA